MVVLFKEEAREVATEEHKTREKVKVRTVSRAGMLVIGRGSAQRKIVFESGAAVLATLSVHVMIR